ncbi:hypothetical protein INS49_012803 [Diaporthe citri]|uniref:uncharacterized protein n=1 Tax=Diaporthe citri TaxID=83186 RepID=UPI001C810339|nr:uncharacterized protein INS49_012803 [Diaporthe citri]KAG6359282.1 hypothetical protein INS49_012803 [Diaporthe citri]
MKGNASLATTDVNIWCWTRVNPNNPKQAGSKPEAPTTPVPENTAAPKKTAAPKPAEL